MNCRGLAQSRWTSGLLNVRLMERPAEEARWRANAPAMINTALNESAARTSPEGAAVTAVQRFEPRLSWRSP